MFYDVALCSPPYSTLTYSAPSGFDGFGWAPGMRVAVPLGTAVRCGVILSVKEACPLPSADMIRPMTWPLEREALLSESYMRMVEAVALRSCTTPGRILGNILPQGLRMTERLRVREFPGGGEAGRKPRVLSLGAVAGLDPEPGKCLARKYLDGRADLLRMAEDPADTELCSLACDPPWPVRPRAARQREILDWLMQHGAASRKRLREALPGSSPALTALVAAGLVAVQAQRQDPDESEPEEKLVLPPDPPFPLSSSQREALDMLTGGMAALSRGEHVPPAHLLFGVTGSGKTAVYLELARACLESGRSALLLAPEVAIALKLKLDAEKRFPGMPVHLYHGYQGPVRRESMFRRLAAAREPCLAVGTRSAVFLPLRSIGAIILDEEHAASFKQEERVPYHAKEVAWEGAKRDRAILVLGSATPDIKTFYAAMQGSMPLASMENRVGGGRLPQIDLVDIKGCPASKLLSPAASDALRETVRRGEQAVILLNRRGYSPVMYCLDCGTPARCPSCDVAMTYHKKREQLVCHYCGHTRPWPSPCERCGGLNFLPMGEGTEQLEEKLAAEELAGILPPGGKILRLDRDSVSRQGHMEEILASFARQEGQVLVGTQMLSKGHHFPNVTLALVADGDMGLNLPDYRAAERTFQLLVQSAGRAGRGEKPGRVLIQSRDTSHYCWQYVSRGDYRGFYEHELEIRRRRKYPPFVKLALIRFSWPWNWPAGKAGSEKFAAELRRIGRGMGCIVLGPAPAPIARMQGRVRSQCLIKADAWSSIRAAYLQSLQILGAVPRELHISLDLDPVSML